MIVLEGPYRDWTLPFDRTAATIGVYDGIHRGHQRVLTDLRRQAEGLPLVVVTFDPHPMSVLAPERMPKLLTSRDQKLELLERLGVDAVAVLSFDGDFAATPAEEFIEKVLIDRLHVALVAVGEDFRFGRHREGDVDLLQRLGSTHGFRVEAIRLVGHEMPFSSTGIRRLIATGDVAAAAECLGRLFELRGVVVPGDGRGRQIGIPTANLELAPGLAVPRRGVYAVLVTVDGKTHHGVVNVGVRPTFGGSADEVVEVHVLEFSGDLYGKSLSVQFVARIRDERKFEGIDELVAQIHADIAEAEAQLAAAGH